MAQKTKGKESARRSSAPPQKSRAAKPAASGKKPAKKTGQSAAARSAAVRTKGQPPVEKKTLSNEIKGIIVIAGGIFLLLAFLTEATGAVGGFLKDFFYGLLGFSSAISCIFIILTGFWVFVNKEGRKNAPRFFLLFGLILCTSILVSLSAGDRAAVSGGWTDQVVMLYQNGISGIGGGVIGGGICKLLVMLIGVAGTWVLAIALELILGILLTGVSVEAAFRKLCGVLRKKSGRMHEQANASAEMDPDEDDTPERGFGAGRFSRKDRRQQEPEDISEHSRKKKESPFFDDYFSGGETIPDMREKHAESGPKDADDAPEPPKRFVIEEDDELLKNILPAEDKEPEAGLSDTLPFRLDNMKTGTISELPRTEADGKVVVRENPEDEDPVFTPPSEAKLEDVAAPSTKAAMEAGVPLDRAVVAGRRMETENPSQMTPAERIENEIERANAVPPRMMEYYMPTLDLLDPPKPRKRSRQEVRAELEEKANRLLETLHSFKVDAKIINITQGPSVTRFELQPGVGIKVSKIIGLSDDIALSLAAPGIRIEAPIPGKSAIGIEIPNKEASPVPIREVLESDKFQNFSSKTAFALGKDIAGSCVIADIAKFPHVLIAGQTGSGKSVCINSLILSILFKAKPDEVKLIMVDPKMVELGIYNGIPHLLIPVVTDPKHAAGALNWAVGEMQNRYNLLKDNNVRNLKGYNALMEERGESESKLPEIVIIIDEFADLMMTAKSEVEDAINRLAALARAAGMYLVIATQRPTVNVITGVIKANIPSRIAFNVTSQIDSRTILDVPGAEKLLGRGDMLYNPSGAMKPLRIQGNFVSDQEIERVVNFIKGQYEACYDEEIIENIQKEQERVAANLENGTHSDSDDETTSRSGEAKDELFFQAVEMVLDNGQASVAMFQRRFKIGYQRAARLIDQMEERRIIGPYEGTKPRQVLISRQEFNEMRMHE